MNDGYKKAGDLIDTLFADFSGPKEIRAVPSVWKKTVSSVKPNGEQLLAHCRVVDYKNGMVIAEADHSAWIQLLQFNKKYILTGLQRGLPQLKIQNIVFRLKKSPRDEYDSQKQQTELTRTQMASVYEKKFMPPEQLRKQYEETIERENVSSAKMDEKLQKLFDKLKNDIQNS